ncbi:MAG: hypothetical protein ABSE40_04760 [Candidatus Sulfotelmatobacter sp.]|jgi:hypothetical protein
MKRPSNLRLMQRPILRPGSHSLNATRFETADVVPRAQAQPVLALAQQIDYKEHSMDTVIEQFKSLVEAVKRSERLPSMSRLITAILRITIFALLIQFITKGAWALPPAASPKGCQVRTVDYEGWKAQDLFNEWVHVIIVPQLGGRVMQVKFGEHEYLFVNPRYKGQYIPPAAAAKTAPWINYGGDKLWPLPEGQGDAEHWPGPVSDALDDGEYSFRVVSEKTACTVRLEGPPDLSTGLQYSREIVIGTSSPEISFHAEMKNASDHPIRWSVQSVTQYDTADTQDRTRYNHDFWAFAPTNPQSAFVDGYLVRAGLADDPSFSVKDGWFTLHWLYLENEVWLDSDAGWIAVVDDSSQFGMIEKFQYAKNAEYPGRASVIFYKNGGALELDASGMPRLRSSDPQRAPYYMEAELNSPMIRLEPGASSAFDTKWYPVRADKNLKYVGSAGVVEIPLTAVLESDGIRLAGKFGVFFPGRLSARFYDTSGVEQHVDLGPVDPLHTVQLNQTIQAAAKVVRVSLHLDDGQGSDLGVVSEAEVTQ